MPRFAELETRVNDAVMTRLANARAQLAAGEPFDVVFDRPYADPFTGEIDASAPKCMGRASELGDVGRGDAITIDDASYRVERAEPDGTGLVRLELRSA